LEEAKACLSSRSDLSFGTKVPHNATARRSVELHDEDGTINDDRNYAQISTD